MVSWAQVGHWPHAREPTTDRRHDSAPLCCRGEHAPGGLGVLELVFITGLPEMNQSDVLAALLVFRMFYLIIPFILSLGVILGFERSQYARGDDAPGDVT